jgi:O-antigen/teichoic acid export membrane protein
MAVISIALPLAYQSDRVVLAHFASTDALAAYSLVAILYGPLLSVISIGGQTLWPLFIRLSGSGEWQATYRLSMKIFALLGTALGCGLMIAGPYVSHFVASDGAGDSARWTTYLLFGLLLFMFACHTTNGMLLMDAAGRRFQAVGSVLLLVIKIPLSILLAPKLGADGVILSTLLAASICLVAPAALTLREKLRSGRLYRSRPKHLATAR